MVIFLLSVFIAFALGLILFFSLQEKAPDELSFLKDKSTPVRVAAPGATASYKNWDVFQKDNGSSTILVNGTTFVPAKKPVPFIISLKCESGGLSSYIQFGSQLNFTKQDRSDSAIVYFDKEPQLWGSMPEFTDKYVAKDPKSVLAQMKSKKEIKLMFMENRAKNPTEVVLKTDGLNELVSQLPRGCQ